MDPATILFVCTGNICRSPLAEVAALSALTAHFQVPELGVAGLRVASAGTHAIRDRPPTPEMQAVAAEVGLDLSKHRATQAEPRELAGASLVYAMEVNQVIWLRSQRPDMPVELLGEADIDDPYGSTLAEYRRARQEIVAAVQARLPEMIALADH